MMTKTKTSWQSISKLLAVLLAVLLVAAYIPTIYVGAATTTIKTLDDLKNISKDLDGTYKLGANIDCGGATLEPIGNLKKPFTGKFTCPTSSDGKPMYAISNFKISVRIGATSRKDQNSMYKSNGDSKWCVGFFGVTHNATFENIVLLNANVTSDVYGGSTTGGSYSESYNGMNEQGTGIFAGVAVGTTFKNCGVQGMIASMSNNVGAFVGWATKEVKASGSGSVLASSSNGCVIQNCYAYGEANGGYNADEKVGAALKATDLWGWNFGGFIGKVSSTKLTGCFFDGNASCGTWMNQGGFIGTFDQKSSINACYSTGIGKSLEGPFSGLKGDTADICTVAKQCYSNLKLGDTAYPVDSNARSGNFVTPTVGSNQDNTAGDDRFAVKTISEINAAFASNSNWQTYSDGATLPTVKALTGKTIKTTADLPASGPAASGDGTPGSSTGSGSGTGSGSASGSGSSTGSDSAGDTNEEVVDDSELLTELNACETADAIVELFPSLDKALAESILAYKGENGEFASIDDLKKVEGVTDEIIETMRSDFLNGTSDTEGGETGAGGSGTIEVIQDKNVAAMSTAEMILVIVLSALILITLAGSVVMIILLAKKIKSLAPAGESVEATQDEQ